jgi:hypothetical protein
MYIICQTIDDVKALLGTTGSLPAQQSVPSIVAPAVARVEPQTYVSNTLSPVNTVKWGTVTEEVRSLQPGTTKIIQSHSRAAITSAAKRLRYKVSIKKHDFSSFKVWRKFSGTF